LPTMSAHHKHLI